MAGLEYICFALAVFFPLVLVFFNGLHIVDEGHVGIYFRGGALLDSISEPGYNFKLPILTSFENV
jgi:regulator of protease activity HflC (stomatin/prohibitin superfamily)